MLLLVLGHLAAAPAMHGCQTGGPGMCALRLSWRQADVQKSRCALGSGGPSHMVAVMEMLVDKHLSRCCVTRIKLQAATYQTQAAIKLLHRQTAGHGKSYTRFGWLVLAGQSHQRTQGKWVQRAVMRLLLVCLQALVCDVLEGQYACTLSSSSLQPYT